MVPKGWEKTTVGLACNIKNNLRLPISSEERDKVIGNYPYFGPTGILGYINDYKIDEEFALIGEDGDHFLKHKEKEMTLMFTGKANVNNHAHIITNSAKCLVSWFHASFVHRDISSHLTRQGAKRYKLTKAALEKLDILLPPLPEQKKIAQILSAWDKAITTTKKLLANSQQQKKALMERLLTGKKRLLDGNGVRFSGEWHRAELGTLLDYKQPTAHLVDSTAYDNRYTTPVLTAGKSFVLGYTNEEHGIYKEDLPVIIFDDFTTDSKFVDFPFKAKSSAMKILTAKKGISIKYVFEAMQLLDFQVGGHQRHWISIFSNLVIPLPDKEEQQKIAHVLSVADQEISAIQNKLATLKNEKKALMQQLLTGKRRVKVEEAA